MTVNKEAVVGISPNNTDHQVSQKQLDAINTLSKKTLTASDVYIFSLRLCDNLVDRDAEFFTRKTLEELAPLFVGKTGIFDHNWSAKNQAARIYQTEIVEEQSVIADSGEMACYLKGYAYMLRNDANEDLISEIDAGIKKEISVSCAVSQKICSICEENIDDHAKCRHIKGQYYKGKRCVVKLENATDAFEWSFVAVPAQSKAGVIKALQDHHDKVLPSDMDDVSCKEQQKEFEALQKHADIGRRYLNNIRQDVVALALMAYKNLDKNTLDMMVSNLDECQLEKVKQSYESQVQKHLPLYTQLSYEKEPVAKNEREDHVFCI